MEEVDRSNQVSEVDQDGMDIIANGIDVTKSSKLRVDDGRLRLNVTIWFTRTVLLNPVIALEVNGYLRHVYFKPRVKLDGSIREAWTAIEEVHIVASSGGVWLCLKTDGQVRGDLKYPTSYFLPEKQ